jgi:hypothetical protein
MINRSGVKDKSQMLVKFESKSNRVKGKPKQWTRHRCKHKTTNTNSSHCSTPTINCMTIDDVLIVISLWVSVWTGLCFHPKRPWVLASLHNGIIQLYDYRMEVTTLTSYSLCGVIDWCVVWCWRANGCVGEIGTIWGTWRTCSKCSFP